MGRNLSRRFLEEGELLEREWIAGDHNYAALISGEEDAWRLVLTASWRAAIERFGNDTTAEIMGEVERGSVRFDPFDGAINAFVEEHVATQVARIQARSITLIQRVVEKAALEGLSAAATARSVRDIYKRWAGKDPELPFDNSRAMTISRTEIHSASGYASHEAANQSGVVIGKRWISSRDGSVRDEHTSLDDGTVYALNEAYPNGLRYPGDPAGSAEEAINCRCQELYETGPGAEPIRNGGRP